MPAPTIKVCMGLNPLCRHTASTVPISSVGELPVDEIDRQADALDHLALASDRVLEGARHLEVLQATGARGVDSGGATGRAEGVPAQAAAVDAILVVLVRRGAPLAALIGLRAERVQDGVRMATSTWLLSLARRSTPDPDQDPFQFGQGDRLTQHGRCAQAGELGVEDR
jgi:hypothetical protein